MSRLFSLLGHSHQRKLRPITFQICQSRSKILPSVHLTLRNCPRLLRFCKSGEISANLVTLAREWFLAVTFLSMLNLFRFHCRFVSSRRSRHSANSGWRPNRFLNIFSIFVSLLTQFSLSSSIFTLFFFAPIYTIFFYIFVRLLFLLYLCVFFLVFLHVTISHICHSPFYILSSNHISFFRYPC